MKTRKRHLRRAGRIATVAATALAATAFAASIVAGAPDSNTSASQPVVATIVQF